MIDNQEIVVRRADHVGFSVASLDAALRFWIDGLGGAGSDRRDGR